MLMYKASISYVLRYRGKITSVSNNVISVVNNGIQSLSKILSGNGFNVIIKLKSCQSY